MNRGPPENPGTRCALGAAGGLQGLCVQRPERAWKCAESQKGSVGFRGTGSSRASASRGPTGLGTAQMPEKVPGTRRPGAPRAFWGWRLRGWLQQVPPGESHRRLESGRGIGSGTIIAGGAPAPRTARPGKTGKTSAAFGVCGRGERPPPARLALANSARLAPPRRGRARASRHPCQAFGRRTRRPSQGLLSGRERRGVAYPRERYGFCSATSHTSQRKGNTCP